MANRLFNRVPISKPGRNLFDLSHESLLTCKMGQYVPFYLQEIVPGDTFKVSSEIFARFAPLRAPVMHNIDVVCHYFFVPNRLVYDKWEDFITGGEQGTDIVPFPTVTPPMDPELGLYTEGSLWDYMNLPTVADEGSSLPKVSALPFRAYQLIYNEYIRDQTLIDEVPITKNSTVSYTEARDILQLRNKCWEKDYFTSALPNPQRGGDVHLPLQGEAPVNLQQVDGVYPIGHWVQSNGAVAPQGDASFRGAGVGGSDTVLAKKVDSGQSPGVTYDPNGGLFADMSAVTSTTVNELRRAMRLQTWLEKQARGGSRYIETIRSHFGVRSSDARLQRPEFLGGFRKPVQISEVLQTSESQQTPQGTMAGHSATYTNNRAFKRFFEEHGYVIGCMCFIPRTSYFQGVPRHFMKFDKFDYYWPEFAHLGEQEVKDIELFFDTTKSQENQQGTFGYQSRYSEYKFSLNQVHGLFRSQLLFWHLARNFSTMPKLNGDFVTARPSERIFPIDDETAEILWAQPIWVQLYNDVKALRPMPRFGEPTL